MDRNVPIVIDLTNTSTFSRTIPLEWPIDVVDGSKYAKVEVIGKNKRYIYIYIIIFLYQVTSWVQFSLISTN